MKSTEKCPHCGMDGCIRERVKDILENSVPVRTFCRFCGKPVLVRGHSETVIDSVSKRKE